MRTPPHWAGKKGAERKTRVGSLMSRLGLGSWAGWGTSQPSQPFWIDCVSCRDFVLEGRRPELAGDTAGPRWDRSQWASWKGS